MAESFRLNTAGLLNQIGMLAFLNGGEDGKTLYKAFVTGQVCYEVYKRLTVSQADVLRAETILRISEYVKKNPRASQAQLKSEVQKEIQLFAQKVAELQGMA
ncbi:uncharacterized protein [Montipora capricornis]|uniref:uncharacterized protein n=1 Tax=Montipora capricornis TaxID=246305 RepID=UPI0035F17BB2